MSSNIKKLVTHNGSFHADDIFACATLILYLEKNGEIYEITRTRDEEKVKSADYVFDVGMVYDENSYRFDHHMPGGAGARPNNIQYSSFGLVWKKLGGELSKFEKVAKIIDKKLAEPIDAGDNAQNSFELTGDTFPYLIQSAFFSFRPSWKNLDEDNLLQGFLKCVDLAKVILKNEIMRGQAVVEAEELVLNAFQESTDKRIIVLEQKYPWEEQLQSYDEPMYAVFPRVGGLWGVEGVSKKGASFEFERRKNFPTSWGGLRDEELIKLTGVSDAVFCHRGLFMCVAKSKEGAIKLAQLALES